MTTRARAKSRSASGSTTTAALPPSSRVTFLSKAFFLTSQPTAGLPVNVTFLTASSVRRISDSLYPAGTTFSPPEG